MSALEPKVVFQNTSLISLRLVMHEMPNTVVENVDLSGCHFKLMNLSRSGFNQVKLIDGTIYDSNMIGSYFTDCDFSNVFLDQVNIGDSEFTRTRFDNTKITETSFADSGMTQVSFKGAQIENVDFNGTTLTGVDFTGAKLKCKTIDFTGTKFNDCIMPTELIQKLNLTQEQRHSLLSSSLSASQSLNRAPPTSVGDDFNVVDERVAVKIPIEIDYEQNNG